MKGKDLKEFLACNGISISHLAKLLSYSDQRLHSALKSDDLKSGLLEEIARVTNRNVCDFYVQHKDVITAQDPTVLRLVDKIAEQAKEIGRLEQELEDAKRKKGLACLRCPHRGYCRCRLTPILRIERTKQKDAGM